MLERDYLMRQFMQLFEALQNIIRRRKKGENKQALEDVSFFYSILKMDKDTGKLNIEELMKWLVEEKKLNNDQLEMVAYVLKEQGELAEYEEERSDFFRKSYFMFEKVERESITFSLDRLMRIEELKEYLN
jgi:predicted  nucleic acid-binding Zn ribbon protein